MPFIVAFALLAAAPPQGWEEAWTLDLSRGASARPVWADSLILVASLDRNVHLVRPGSDPRVVWKGNYRGGFEAPPVVAGDRIYLAETARGRRLLAIDRRTRETTWTADAGDLMARPVVDGGTVYTVSSVGQVMAWNAATGVERWRTELETRVVATPALLGDRLVVAASDGRLFAVLAATGALAGESDPEAGPIQGDPAPSPDAPGAVLFATLEGQVIEVDGELEVTDRRSFPSAFYAGPTVEGGTILLSGHEGTVWAYDWAAARVEWRREGLGALRSSPVAGRGLVAVGDLGGRLYVLDPASGELRWHARLNDAVTASPLTSGARIYVVTERGRLYAFHPTGPASAP
ncbi:MAG TPA: PQQ-binding-like beta-propeller repeat protein [Gemmatimonadota bacterium]|nr:PQQ-binding-like beta-propeller repeat protein [Gemmatimonadota bacterium]